MKKEELQKIIKRSGFYQWEIAETLGISEYTLCKRLRRPLTEDFEAEVIRAIETLKEMDA